jgi:hypothetical protein
LPIMIVGIVMSVSVVKSLQHDYPKGI